MRKRISEVIYIVLKILSLIVLFFLIMIIIESINEFKTFKIKRYTVCDKKIRDAFDGYKIAMIGDMHNYHYDDNDSLVISSLKKENPDIVILVGDMVLCRKKAAAENLKTAKFVNELARCFPLFYGIGNHEKGLIDKKDDVGDIWQDYKHILSDKVSFVSNELIHIQRDSQGISLYGLDIDRYFYRRVEKIPMGRAYIEEKLGNPTEDFNILIAHNPDYFEDYADWGADLTLSGHIHGGMVRLPFIGGVISPKLKFFPKYDYGYFEKKEKKMIITSGLGGHHPKLRVNNYPEIVMITLKKAEKELLIRI